MPFSWSHRAEVFAVLTFILNATTCLTILRVQPRRCSFSQFIFFCKTLYVFQTVFPSIIRSSKLHIQCQVLV